MKKKWQYYEQQTELVKQIAKEHNISELLARILINRGIVEEEAIRIFLNPKRDDFHNPFLMLDMEKATKRIIKAIKNKEKTIIYGDYDVDGITSITVLKQFLEERGLDVDYYIPNRLEEGYGLNKEAVQEIAKKEYTLMITVDCGISGIEEIDLANSEGIETIVTDHHEQLDTLPNAYAIINPKRKDNTYPFRGLAGVGVVFKLIQALSLELGLDEKEYLKYLDIVCIGTISDIVPLINENRVIAKLGLMLVKCTKNIGLRELIKETGYKNINSTMISFGIAPRINACGRMGRQEEALQLFLTKDVEKAKEITKHLEKYNVERQETEKSIFNQAMQKLEKEDLENISSIVLAGENWHHGVIGIVASRITEKYFKPTILICIEGNEGKGSGRSIPGFDLHQALVDSSKFLKKYGGHEMAVGLSLEKDKINDFKKNFEKISENKNVKQLIPVINIDCEIMKKDLNKETIEQIKLLEPFGEMNKQPLVVYKNLKIVSIRSLSEGKHLKLMLKDDNETINAIGFNLGELANEYLIGDKIDIVGILETNTYNGQEQIQINIRDIMKSV
mgnify:FL=1|jgi:single-stranded-DNA-specific exonuclease